MVEGATRLGPWWLITGVLVVAVGVGLAVGFILTQDDDDGDEVTVASDDTAGVATAEPTAGAIGESDDGSEGDSAGQSGQESGGQEPPPAQPEADPNGDDVSLDSFEFSDEVLEAAIAEGAANPLVGAPSRDSVATELLIAQLSEAGVDLTGMEVIVYPASSVPSFVLLTTDDSTPLLASEDDAALEAFVTGLLGSPMRADFEVEKLIMQHSGTDESGAFVMTLMVRLEDLETATTSGADVLFEQAAIQMERP
jgi:hypothetical protein